MVEHNFKWLVQGPAIAAFSEAQLLSDWQSACAFCLVSRAYLALLDACKHPETLEYPRQWVYERHKELRRALTGLFDAGPPVWRERFGAEEQWHQTAALVTRGRFRCFANNIEARLAPLFAVKLSPLFTDEMNENLLRALLSLDVAIVCASHMTSVEALANVIFVLAQRKTNPRM